MTSNNNKNSGINFGKVINEVEILNDLKSLINFYSQSKTRFQTGLALDGSGSMRDLYGKLMLGKLNNRDINRFTNKGQIQVYNEDGIKVMQLSNDAYRFALDKRNFSFSRNVMEPVFQASLHQINSRLSESGSTDLIYWACDNGSKIEFAGNITEAKSRTIAINGPKKFGNEKTILMPVLDFFSKNRSKSKYSLYFIISDGKIDDFDQVKNYAEKVLYRMNNNEISPVKFVFIGLGNDLDLNQLKTLHSIKTDSGFTIWDYKIVNVQRENLPIKTVSNNFSTRNIMAAAIGLVVVVSVPLILTLSGNSSENNKNNASINDTPDHAHENLVSFNQTYETDQESIFTHDNEIIVRQQVSNPVSEPTDENFNELTVQDDTALNESTSFSESNLPDTIEDEPDIPANDLTEDTPDIQENNASNEEISAPGIEIADNQEAYSRAGIEQSRIVIEAPSQEQAALNEVQHVQEEEIEINNEIEITENNQPHIAIASQVIEQTQTVSQTQNEQVNPTQSSAVRQSQSRQSNTRRYSAPQSSQANEEINFDSNDYTLSMEEYMKLQRFYYQIQDQPGTVRITGNADIGGSEGDYNALSDLRAEHVEYQLRNMGAGENQRIITNQRYSGRRSASITFIPD